jgi:O-antigen chain-terminating methyltransferase
MKPLNTTDHRLLEAAAKVVRERNVPGMQPHPSLDRTAGGTAQAGWQYEGGSIHLPGTRRLAENSDFGTQVGDMPPQPETLRGRVGSVFVRIVRKMLFWYTAQIRSFQALIREAAREQVAAFQRVGVEQERQASTVVQLLRRIERLERDDRLDVFMKQQQTLQEMQHQLQLRLNDVDEQQNRLSQDQKNLRDLYGALEERQETIQSNLVGLQDRSTDLSARRDILSRADDLDRQSDVPAMHQKDIHARFPSRKEWQARMDTLFVDHAGAFRGEFREIKERLSVYSPYIQDAFNAAGQAPALDLGCGRGEWLEMLRDVGIPATGVDTNEELIAFCRSRGVAAVRGDLLDHLCTAPADSHSIVTAFHVIEHLAFNDWLQLINHTARILKVGGIAIFETPNPTNFFVGCRNFYLDPTHRRPIPHELLSFIVNASGLHAIQTLPLHAYPETMHLVESDCPAVRFINQNFYGPQDYAVIARKR